MTNGQLSILGEVRAVLGEEPWAELKRELKSPSEKRGREIASDLGISDVTGLAPDYINEYVPMCLRHDEKRLLGHVRKYPPKTYSERYKDREGLDVDPANIRVRTVDVIANAVRERIEGGKLTANYYMEAGKFVHILVRGEPFRGGLA